MIPFNFHHLYYFFVIAREGSVSKAAKVLRLGQPTLSTQLKQFEECQSIKLFERGSKKLVLTEEGQYVLAYAQEIFDLGQEFMDGLADRSKKPGRLQIQIGALVTTPKSFLNLLFKVILKIEPNAYISLHEDGIDELKDGIRSHLFDLVLTDIPFQNPFQEEIQNHLVGRIPIVFCANPKLAKDYKHLPKDLDGAPMILPTVHSQVYHAVQEYFVLHKVAPRIVADIQDIEVVHHLALAGIGIAPLNELTVRDAVKSGKLVVLDEKAKHPIHDTIYLITKRRKKPHPLIEKIIDHFRLTI